MEILKTKQEVFAYIIKQKQLKKSIGLVPTMGALHDGHLSIVKTSKKNNGCTVVTIFVNPTQFDKQDDLINYPKTIENDLRLLENTDCDAVFIPSVDEIYAKNVASVSSDFDGLEHQMEGKFRTGHFDGVRTIVKRFFEIVTPDKAYFGKKDFQQLQIIKKMVGKHQLPVEIIGCEIFREKDGLAMSSRNVRLTKNERAVAPFIYKTLQAAKLKTTKNTVNEVLSWIENEFVKQPLFSLEYVTIAEETTLKTVEKINPSKNYRVFIAVTIGDVRLIDNVGINCL